MLYNRIMKSKEADTYLEQLPLKLVNPEDVSIFSLHLSLDTRNFLIKNNIMTLEDVQETIAGFEAETLHLHGLNEERILKLKSAVAEYQSRPEDPRKEIAWILAHPPKYD